MRFPLCSFTIGIDLYSPPCAQEEVVEAMESALPSQARPVLSTPLGPRHGEDTPGTPIRGFPVDPAKPETLTALFTGDGGPVRPTLNKDTGADAMSTMFRLMRDTRDDFALQVRRETRVVNPPLLFFPPPRAPLRFMLISTLQVAQSKIRQDTATRIKEIPAEAKELLLETGEAWQDTVNTALWHSNADGIQARSETWLMINPANYKGDERLVELGRHLDTWADESALAVTNNGSVPEQDVVNRDDHEGITAFWRPPNWLSPPASSTMPPPPQPQERYPFLFARRLAMAGDEEYATKFEFIMRYYLAVDNPGPAERFWRERDIDSVVAYSKSNGSMILDMSNADDMAFYRALDPGAVIGEEGRARTVDMLKLDAMFFAPGAPVDAGGVHPRVFFQGAYQGTPAAPTSRPGVVDSMKLSLLRPHVSAGPSAVDRLWARWEGIKGPAVTEFVVNVSLAATFATAATVIDAYAPSITTMAASVMLVPFMGLAVKKLLWPVARGIASFPTMESVQNWWHEQTEPDLPALLPFAFTCMPRAWLAEPIGITQTKIETQLRREQIIARLTNATNTRALREQLSKSTGTVDRKLYTEMRALLTGKERSFFPFC